MKRNLTVLVAEDDPNDAELLRLALRAEGLGNPVQIVENGQKAIAYLCGQGEFSDRQRYPFPSVMFTDLKMPMVGGFEILQWLRDHPECNVIPVIVLSGSKLPGDVKRAYQLGANSYIQKPVDLDNGRLW